MKAFAGGLKIAPDRASVLLVPLHRSCSSCGEYLGRARHCFSKETTRFSVAKMKRPGSSPDLAHIYLLGIASRPPSAALAKAAQSRELWRKYIRPALDATLPLPQG